MHREALQEGWFPKQSPDLYLPKGCISVSLHKLAQKEGSPSSAWSFMEIDGGEGPKQAMLDKTIPMENALQKLICKLMFFLVVIFSGKK